jgi:hypothetical protein
MFQQVNSNRNETAKLEGGKPIFDFVSSGDKQMECIQIQKMK